MTISSFSRPKKPELSQHIQACKDLSEIGDLLEKEVLVRIDSAAYDQIYVKGYSAYVHLENLSKKIEDLIEKVQVFSSPSDEILAFGEISDCLMIQKNNDQRKRTAKLLLEKAFVPIKTRFDLLSEEDRRFYVSMNLYNRSVLFPNAADEGFGVFAHVQPLLTLGKSSKELKEVFLKKQPLIVDVPQGSSLTTSILFPSSKDQDSESEK